MDPPNPIAEKFGVSDLVNKKVKNLSNEVAKNQQTLKVKSHPPAVSPPAVNSGEKLEVGNDLLREKCNRLCKEVSSSIKSSGTLEVNLGPSENVKPITKNTIDRSLSPKVIPKSVDGNSNGEKSAKIDGILGHSKPLVSPITENPNKSASKCEITSSKNASQCHLYVYNKNNVKSNVCDDDILKKKLGTKMKPKKQKTAPETPEKSEIFRMFEKLKKKKEQSVTQEPQIVSHNVEKSQSRLQPKPDSLPDDSVKITSIKWSQCERGTKFENSPKLKPKNRFKFEEIRLFFEVKIPENTSNATSITQLQHKDTKVKNLSKISNMKYLEKNRDIDNIGRDNIDIIKAQFDINPIKKSPLETPKKSGFTDEVSRVDNKVSRVVRSPVPRNRYSPQSDSKKKKTPQRKKNEEKFRKTDNLKSQPPISKFFWNERY